MKNLLEKMRRAREIGVEAAGHKFTVRRPTDEEALAFSNEETTLLSVVKRFVVGWDLCEIDLIPGGGADKQAFDADLFGEWVADQPDVWEPLGKAILDAYRAHAEKREAAAKN